MAARWTKAEDATLIRRYADGVLVRQIAAELGRSEDAVTARRRLLGLPARRDPGWSPGEDQLLRVASRSGVPVRFIARELGRPAAQVRWRRRTLDLTAPAAPAYSPDEESALRGVVASDGDFDDLGRRVGRSADALRLHAQTLGLWRPSARPRWSPAEDALLRDGYERGLTCHEVARALPGRSAGSVAARARKLGLATHGRRWTAVDDARFRRLAATGTLEDAARLLGRTPDALRQRAGRMGIAPPPASAAIRGGARWTAEEDELLAVHAALNPAVLGVLLGRSDRAVTERLAGLGLRTGRERSPHHPVPRNGGLTPGELSLAARALAGGCSPRRVLLLAERLEVSPAAVRATASQDRRRPADGPDRRGGGGFRAGAKPSTTVHSE